MTPELKTGSLVVTSPVAAESVQIGDVITFCDNSPQPNVITHRVVKKWDNTPIYFKTKGDACTIADPFTVSEKNLIGKVTFDVAGAGYLFRFLKTPSGYCLGIAIPTIIMLILYLKALLAEIKKYRLRKVQGTACK